MSKRAAIAKGLKPTVNATTPVVDSKIVPIGVNTDFRFARHGVDGKKPDQIAVNFIVCTAAEWMEHPDSDHSGWSKVLLGDGYVAAAMITPYEHGDYPRNEPDPEMLHVLRKFREEFSRWVEERSWIKRAEVQFGGNGDLRMNVDIDNELYDQCIQVIVRRSPDF